MKLHQNTRPFSRVPLSALVTIFLVSLLLLQSCKRSETGATWTPVSTTPSAYLEDSVLTSRVKAALLLSPVARSINIGVESHQGVVLLSGMVADQTQLDLAVFVAQYVPGVNKVDSFMFFTGTPSIVASHSHEAPAAQLLYPQRLPDGTVNPPSSANDDPEVVAVATAAEMNKPQAQTPPSPVRKLMRLTYGVLGISSIHDELQIKP